MSVTASVNHPNQITASIKQNNILSSVQTSNQITTSSPGNASATSIESCAHEIPPIDPEDMIYTKQIDFISDTLIYRGQALPGTPLTAQGWRINKLTIGDDDDVSEQWAGGSARFDNAWTDRLSLTYS
jgi:hypothetical protein